MKFGLNTKLKLQIRWETILILSFFSYDLVYAALSRVTGTSISKIVCNIMIVSILVIVIAKRPSRLKMDSIIVILLSITAFVISYVFHPEYADVMLNNDSWGIFENVFVLNGGVFAYLIIRTEDNPEYLLDDLKLSAYIVWLTFTIKTSGGISFESVSVVSGNTILRTYNQVYGYEFLFSAIIFTYFFFKEKKKKYGFFVIIILIQILNYASRTAIVSYVLYLVLLILFGDLGYKSLKKRVLLGSLLIASALLLSSDAFMNWFSSICNQFGISSKIIDALISGENSIDGGREMVWGLGISLIKNNIWGLGVYSDHYYMGVYVHNIVIEIFMSYGWILGTVIIAGLVIIIIRMLITGENNAWKSLFLMFLSMTLIRLSLSYSYWYDGNFWFMLASFAGYLNSNSKKDKTAGISYKI